MIVQTRVADAIIRKMTGHRSEELERYKQLSSAFKQQTVELIAGRLSRHVSTNLSPAPKIKRGRSKEQPQMPHLSGGSYSASDAALKIQLQGELNEPRVITRRDDPPE